MDTISIILPASRPRALRLLLDQVLAGGDAVLLVEGDEGRTLLDEAAQHLAGQRHRVLRADAGGPGGLGLSGLMAQVAGQPGLAAQDDAVLERGFRMMTAPDAACTHIVLLVSGAQDLHRKTLRYIEFACRAGASLRLVLAGEPSLMQVLSWDEAGFLHARLASRPVIAVEAPEPGAAVLVAPHPDVSAATVPVRPGAGGAAPYSAQVAPAAAKVRPSAGRPMIGLAIASGMATSLALGVGISRHEWPTVQPGSPASADSTVAGDVTRPVTQAAPAAQFVSGAAKPAERTVAEEALPMPVPPAANPAPTLDVAQAAHSDQAAHSALSAPLSPARSPASPAASSELDKAEMAGPIAPQPAPRDAPALPTSPVAGTMAVRSASPDRTASAPGAALPAGPPEEHAAAGSTMQQSVAHGMSATLAPPAIVASAAATIAGQPASLAQAAAPAVDDAGTILPTPPRPRRRSASQPEDASVKDGQQEVSRRDMASMPHPAARPVSLHARVPEEGGDPPVPPPLIRQPRHAALRPALLESRLFKPEPLEPVAGGPSYIGTFGMDANGLRTFRPGQ